MFIAPVLHLVFLAAPPVVETKFEQVAPASAAGKINRSTDQTRAVILLHGYRFYRTEDDVARADFRDWQRPGCLLVRTLAKDADVFSYGYSQNASVGDIVAQGKLVQHVKDLRAAGYREVVLVGHSAGGLIVRQFVEDHPDCGVTKVIQVCAPNGGTTMAALESLKAQRSFLDSLTPDGRKVCLKERAGKTIPADVQFVCVLSNANGNTDGLVRCDCQWTPDLQRQLIPVMLIKEAHPSVPRTARGAEAIADAVRAEHPRWTAERVKEMKKQVFKE